MGAKVGNDDDNDEADNTKGGKRGGVNLAVKDGNDDNDKEDVTDVMGVLPPLVSCRVQRLKYLNTERERVTEQYLEEIPELETKYSDLCKPLYEERGNVVAGRLDGSKTETMTTTKRT